MSWPMMSGHLLSCKVSQAFLDRRQPANLPHNTGVFLQYNGSAGYAFVDAGIASTAAFIVSGYATPRASKAVGVSAADTIPAGPYFAAVTGRKVALFEAWRLYSDTERACTSHGVLAVLLLTDPM